MAILQHIRKVGAHSNQDTRSGYTCSPRPIVASDSQPPPTRPKRKRRGLSSEHQDTQSESPNHSEPPPKRQRTPGSSYFNSCTNTSIDSNWSSWDRIERSYWDSLSQLRLTSNALRELNRRNGLVRSNAPPNRDIAITGEQHFADITRFARHGGPNLSDIRKHRNPVGVSSTPDSMPQNNKGKAKSGRKPHANEENKGKRSSAYDGNFEQHLIDNNVFPASRAKRALNHADWNEVLIRPRASPSRSSDESYLSFVRAAEGAHDEDEVMSKAFPKIVGNSRHASGQNVPFGHLEQITKKIVIPQPDWYQGETPGEGNRTLRERLDKAIIPSTRKERAFLPTYFAEAKGPDGSFTVARRQACHDGALGARAMHSLQSLGGTGAYDGNAYAASAIYHGEGDLKLYIHHMTQPRGPGSLPHTHMTPLMAVNLMNSPESFREGRTAFRNVGDKANEYRVQFISDANRRNDIFSPPPPTTVPEWTRKPHSCQTHIVESIESDPSESRDGDSGNYRESSRAPTDGNPLRPKSVIATPKRLAKKCPSSKPTLRRRKPNESSRSDASNSSEEESSKVPRKRKLRRPKVVTISPEQLTTSKRSAPRLGCSQDRWKKTDLQMYLR